MLYMIMDNHKNQNNYCRKLENTKNLVSSKIIIISKKKEEEKKKKRFYKMQVFLSTDGKNKTIKNNL